jgi:hypothetical protein
MRELAETMPIPEADVIVKVRDDKGLDGPPHGG